MKLRDIIDQAEKYNLLRDKPEISILFSEDKYTDQDWAEVRLANETKKYNPEGQKIRQKIIDRLKNDTP